MRIGWTKSSIFSILLLGSRETTKADATDDDRRRGDRLEYARDKATLAAGIGGGLMGVLVRGREDERPRGQRVLSASGASGRHRERRR